MKAVVAAIEARGGRAAAAVFDVTNIDHVKVVAGSTAFDTLVNNVGINRPKPMVEAIDMRGLPVWEIDRWTMF